MIILRDWTGRNRLLPASSAGGTLGGLREMVFDVCGIAPEEQMLSSSSIALSFALAASEGKLPDEILLTVQVSARCLGGKGGFGAMLRGQSSRPGMKQVTPNTGAMRDLSGRRLRHVEQEQKLKDWAADAEKRKAEKEEEKKAKRQKYQEETHSVASEYVAQAAVDVDEIKDAVLKVGMHSPSPLAVLSSRRGKSGHESATSPFNVMATCFLRCAKISLHVPALEASNLIGLARRAGHRGGEEGQGAQGGGR